MIASAEEFVRLRRSDDRAEYQRAASERASLTVWREVLGGYPDMKVWVAHNKTVPLEVLRALAIDPDPSVRHAVAMKRKLDADLFRSLAADADPSVRQQIACNAKAPRHILEALAQDTEPLVREAALERLTNRP